MVPTEHGEQETHPAEGEYGKACSEQGPLKPRGQDNRAVAHSEAASARA